MASAAHTADLMLEVIERITNDTTGLERDAFLSSQKEQDATAYRLLALGELAGKLPDSVTQRHPEVSWAKITGLRNRLAHEYFDTEATILWDIVTDHLVALAAACRAIIAESQS